MLWLVVWWINLLLMPRSSSSLPPSSTCRSTRITLISSRRISIVAVVSVHRRHSLMPLYRGWQIQPTQQLITNLSLHTFPQPSRVFHLFINETMQGELNSWSIRSGMLITVILFPKLMDILVDWIVDCASLFKKLCRRIEEFLFLFADEGRSVDFFRESGGWYRFDDIGSKSARRCVGRVINVVVVIVIIGDRRCFPATIVGGGE